MSCLSNRLRRCAGSYEPTILHGLFDIVGFLYNGYQIQINVWQKQLVTRLRIKSEWDILAQNPRDIRIVPRESRCTSTVRIAEAQINLIIVQSDRGIWWDLTQLGLESQKELLANRADPH